VIDAEAIVRDDSGLVVFDLIRGHGRKDRAMLCALAPQYLPGVSSLEPTWCQIVLSTISWGSGKEQLVLFLFCSA
jgi:hypothetical protein